MDQPRENCSTGTETEDTALLSSSNEHVLKHRGRHVSTYGHSIIWPQVCCCCQGPVNATLLVEGLNQRMTHSKTWGVPYCADCIYHLRKGQFVENSVLLILAAWGAGIYLFYLFATHDVPFALTVFLSIALPWGSHALAHQAFRELGESKRKPECACGHAAVRYLNWHGTMHHFVMYSPAYIELFVKENRGRAQLRS